VTWPSAKAAQTGWRRWRALKGKPVSFQGRPAAEKALAAGLDPASQPGTCAIGPGIGIALHSAGAIAISVLADRDWDFL